MNKLQHNLPTFPPPFFVLVWFANNFVVLAGYVATAYHYRYAKRVNKMFIFEGRSKKRCWFSDEKFYVEGSELIINKIEDETTQWKIFILPVLGAAIGFALFLGYQFIINFEKTFIGVPSIAYFAYGILIFGTLLFWWVPFHVFSFKRIYKINDLFYLYIERDDSVSSFSSIQN